MGKFKVGDKVRVIDDAGGGRVGDICTIIDEGDNGYYVLDGLTGGVGLFDHRLELVPAWPPKVGDRVRFTKDNPNDGSHYGAKGEVFEVAGNVVHSDHYGDQVSIKHQTIGWNPSAPISALEPATLSISAGKFYKTRDGRKVGPIESDGDTAWGKSLAGYATVFVSTGLANYEGEHKDDFIAEWVDEPTIANDNAAPAKFKVGDRVRVTKAGDANQEQWIGTTFTIDADEDTLDGEQSWSGRDHGSPYRWKESQLAIVPVVTPTAIVALIEDGQPKPASRPYVHATVESATAEAERLAGIHRGQRFGVYVLADTRETDQPAYEYEWQRLAVAGRKIDAIKLVRAATGLHLATAKTAVEDWLARAA